MKLPAEFVVPRRGLAVRRGFEGQLAGWLADPLAPPERPRERAWEGADGTPAPGTSAPAACAGPAARQSRGRSVGGRGGARAVALGDGGRAWVRRCRHGGLLRHLLGEIYWQWPLRPWRELLATEAARRQGVLAPEVLAAGALAVPRRLPLIWLYRAVVVTRELEGRRSLAQALGDAATHDERCAWVERAWACVLRLHRAGIRHPDLNVTNILVGQALAAAPIALIDFDRAVVGRRPVGRLGRALAARRLARSVAKLGLPGLDRGGVAALLRAGREDER